MGDGGTLTFPKLARHHSGLYSCEADNGFGPEPVAREVRLEVEHRPEVSAEMELVRTDLGESQELVCEVVSSPDADVAWSRDGEQLDTRTPSVLLNSQGSRHSLTLLSISEQMLGEYRCGICSCSRTAPSGVWPPTASAPPAGWWW